MLLQEQVGDAVSEIRAKRQELDKLYALDVKGEAEHERIAVLLQELEMLERDVDRANLWLSSCGVLV